MLLHSAILASFPGNPISFLLLFTISSGVYKHSPLLPGDRVQGLPLIGVITVQDGSPTTFLGLSVLWLSEKKAACKKLDPIIWSLKVSFLLRQHLYFIAFIFYHLKFITITKTVLFNVASQLFLLHNLLEYLLHLFLFLSCFLLFHFITLIFQAHATKLISLASRFSENVSPCHFST